MGHLVEFESFENLSAIVTRDEVIDIIDMFFRGEPTSFRIVGRPNPDLAKTKRWRNHRGCHAYNSLEMLHTIWLAPVSIRDQWGKGMSCGGNLKPLTLKHALVQVLTHELQHANQSLKHGSSSTFFSEHKYANKACERDARAFADENFDVTAAYLGLEVTRKEVVVVTTEDEEDELWDIAELLKETRENGAVRLDDVVSQLRGSKLLNPKNVERMTKILRDLDVRVA